MRFQRPVPAAATAAGGSRRRRRATAGSSTPVGRGSAAPRQAGQSFTVQPAARSGSVYILRGAGDVRVAREGRHRRAPRAQAHDAPATARQRGRGPAGFSAAECVGDRMIRRARRRSARRARARSRRAARHRARARARTCGRRSTAATRRRKPGAVGVRVSVPRAATRRRRQQQWAAGPASSSSTAQGSAWRALQSAARAAGTSGAWATARNRGRAGTTFTFPPPAAGRRISARSSSTCSGAAARGSWTRRQLLTEARPRRPERPGARDVAPDVRDQALIAANRRGSLVMMPVTPSALERARCARASSTVHT